MVLGGPDQTPSGTIQDTGRSPGLARETLVSVVSLGLSPRGGGAAGYPPDQRSRRNRWAKVRGQSQRGPRMREEESPRFFQRTSGPAVLVLGPITSRAAARCGPPGRPRYRRVPSSPGGHPGTARTGLWGRELPRGPQQLVSLRGAAPPFPGTKAAARAGAPGTRAEKGCGARPGERRPGNGAPPEDAPKLPSSRVRVYREAAALALRGLGCGEGARSRRLGNLLQSSDS